MRLLPLALLIALTACAPVAAPVTPAASPAVSVAPTAVVTGKALAPKVFVGTVVPTGGGNVIPTGGGNVIPTGGGHLLSLAQAPVADAEVFLADAAGRPYPSLPSVKTDAEGRFTFPAVPADHTFMVVVAVRDTARGKDATLQSLVRSTSLGATTEVDVASSLVTLAVTRGEGATLGEFNAAAFRTATEATAANLSEADLPDLADRTAVLAKIDGLSAAIAELQTALDAIRQDLQEIKESLAKIDEKLDRPTSGGSGNGGSGNGGSASCTAPVTHMVSLKGAYEGYPLRLEIVSPQGNVRGTGTATKAGEPFEFRVPENCAHTLRLIAADGTVLATERDYRIPEGAPPEFELPF